jgi:hypothetical protein
VTVQRRTRVFVKTFSDGLHGGSQAALQAAITYRDTLTTTHLPLELPVHCAILKKTNR